MISVLEIIKDENTVGHKWPSQPICCRVGHPPRPMERQKQRDYPLPRWAPECETADLGEFPSGAVTIVSSWCFVFSRILSQVGGRRTKIRGDICIPVCAYLCRNQIYSPSQHLQIFFLKHECGGKLRVFQPYGLYQVLLILSRII